MDGNEQTERAGGVRAAGRTAYCDAASDGSISGLPERVVYPGQPAEGKYEQNRNQLWLTTEPARA
jgi:hypothetical protein